MTNQKQTSFGIISYEDEDDFKRQYFALSAAQVNDFREWGIKNGVLPSDTPAFRYEVD